MSTSPSSSVLPATLNENDPALNTPQTIDPTADAYAKPKLQKGLTHDTQGHIIPRPSVAAMLNQGESTTIDGLIAAGRLSEANSVLACQRARNPLSHCPDNHEIDAPAIRCVKPMLHEACATPSARTANFRYNHAALHKHLSHPRTSFQVLIFTIRRPYVPSDHELHTQTVEGREAFHRFTEQFEGAHGWQWLFGSDEGLRDTVFHVIHEGDKLPPWPTLNAMWRRIAGEGASLTCHTYDGKDGDTQEEGLRIANSGFVNLWRYGRDRVLGISEAFRKEDLTALYGTFRSYTPPDGEAVTEAAKPELPFCSKCGRQHIPWKGAPLVFPEELQPFDHIIPHDYGQRRKWATHAAMETGSGCHAPPT
jgi:5-methylcytosine-specific restriction endonuclease McrA